VAVPQHGKVSIDRVGLPLAAPLSAMRLLALEHQDARRGQRTGDADAVAAGSFHRNSHSPPRSMARDPSKQAGEASIVVADRQRRDRRPGRIRDLCFVRVAMSVDTNNGIDEFCQTRHGLILSGRGHGRHRPGWDHRAAHL